MALYEVILNQNFFGNRCVNRWNYVSGGVPGSVSGSYALAFGFGAIYDAIAIPPAYPPNTVIGKLVGLQSQSVQFVQITVQNVYDPVDFYQTPFDPALTGFVSGDAESPALAYGFRTNVVNRDIGRGTKRFVGVTENADSNGGVIGSTGLALMDAVAEAMSAIIEYDDEGNALTFSPAVCSKERYDVPDSSPVRHAYRYYGTLATQLAHTALGINWEVYSTVRTQATRQYGRGQ